MSANYNRRARCVPCLRLWKLGRRKGLHNIDVKNHVLHVQQTYEPVMLQSLAGYAYERRRGLAKTCGVVGGVYLVGRYVVNRLEEVRDKVIQERVARDR
jgi:hypothetical protein